MTEPDLFKAISHCKEVISKIDNCPCKDDHKELLYFLEELQFRRELDTELPWEVNEIISRDDLCDISLKTRIKMLFAD